MLVKDFKDIHIDDFPHAFLEKLPEECPHENCNGQTHINDTMTEIVCDNPACPYKVSTRIIGMFTELNIKGIGKATADKIVEQWGITSPTYLFFYEYDEDGSLGGLNESQSRGIQEQLESKKNITLTEFAKLAQLPELQDNVSKIFDGYNSLEEVYSLIDSQGVEFIKSRLSIKKTTESIQAKKTLDTLLLFREDLFKTIEAIDLKIVDKPTLKVLCSEDVPKQWGTKPKYYEYIKNKYKDLYNFDFVKSANKSIDFLIWDSNQEVSEKVKKVRGYNESYEKHRAEGVLTEKDKYIPILNHFQFDEHLSKYSSKGE